MMFVGLLKIELQIWISHTSVCDIITTAGGTWTFIQLSPIKRLWLWNCFVFKETENKVGCREFNTGCMKKKKKTKQNLVRRNCLCTAFSFSSVKKSSQFCTTMHPAVLFVSTRSQDGHPVRKFLLARATRIQQRHFKPFAEATVRVSIRRQSICCCYDNLAEPLLPKLHQIKRRWNWRTQVWESHEAVTLRGVVSVASHVTSLITTEEEFRSDGNFAPTDCCVTFRAAMLAVSRSSEGHRALVSIWITCSTPYTAWNVTTQMSPANIHV